MMYFNLALLIIIKMMLLSNVLIANEKGIFWWQPTVGENFGDYLAKVIVERMIQHSVALQPLQSKDPILFTVGSVIHFARDNDVIWGSGLNGKCLDEKYYHFSNVDVRAVRGPITRSFLLDKNILCPAVYGDPALLLPYLFPEFVKSDPEYDYLIIPNLGEISYFLPYKNVVLPTEPWEDIVKKILKSKLVIAGSLHGIIIAEAFGIPARLIKMTWFEPLLKYQDYYASTGRPHFRYATSVQEALKMGGEVPGYIDLQPLLNSFPYDYFEQKRETPNASIRP